MESLHYIFLGALLCIIVSLLNYRFAERVGFVAWPKTRRTVPQMFPILGPTAVILVTGFLLFANQAYQPFPWVVTSSVIMAIVGWFADRRKMTSIDKLFFQSVVLCSTFFMEPVIFESITTRYGYFALFPYICAGIILMNSIQGTEEVEGLSNIILLLGAASYLLLSSPDGDFSNFYASISFLAGVLIPLIGLTTIRRKALLGNIGGYFLSYLIVVAHLTLPLTTPDWPTRLAITGLSFLVPLADLIGLGITLGRLGGLGLLSERGFLHHRLIQTALSSHAMILLFLCIEFGGIIMAVSLSQKLSMIGSFVPIICFMTQIFVTASLLTSLERASKKRLESYFIRLEEGEPILYLKYELRGIDGKELSKRTMKSIEIRVNAEIRVTDLAVCTPSGALMVTLRDLDGPPRGVIARLEHLLHSEGVAIVRSCEQGVITKLETQQAQKIRARSRS